MPFGLMSAPTTLTAICLTAGVTVLADDVSVHGSGRDAELLGQQVAESCRVEVAARADDAVLGQITDLPRHVCEDVYGVAGYQEDSVRAVFD